MPKLIFSLRPPPPLGGAAASSLPVAVAVVSGGVVVEEFCGGKKLFMPRRNIEIERAAAVTWHLALFPRGNKDLSRGSDKLKVDERQKDAVGELGKIEHRSCARV